MRQKYLHLPPSTGKFCAFGTLSSALSLIPPRHCCFAVVHVVSQDLGCSHKQGINVSPSNSRYRNLTASG
jgi:hypothetical protein